MTSRRRTSAAAPGGTLCSTDRPQTYDVIVCFDNDCEVLQEQTLEVVAGLVYRHKMILAPRVDGLLYPPPAIARFHLDGYEIEETEILGNIFMAIPAELLVDFRWDETLRGVGRRRVDSPVVPRSRWSRRVRRQSSGSTTTRPPWAGREFPEYFARRVKEGGRAQ